MTNYLKYLFLIGLSFVISGCGFHLRKSDALPVPLRTMYLQSSSPYAPFTIALKQTLQASGITMVAKPQTTACNLEILNADLTHSGTNIYSSAQASVYTFTFTVVFRLSNSAGKVILLPQTIAVSRNLTLNPNEILESSNQVDTIKQEMQQEVILKIFNILSSKQVAHEM